MKIAIIMFLISFLSLGHAQSEKEVLSKIKVFGMNLKKELKKGLQKSPQEALKICNIKAPQIAKSVSSNKIKVGRVSLKNRNPKNYPKDWMLEYINSFHSQKIKEKFVVVKLKNGKHGLLKPIMTVPLCLKCHGTKIPTALQKEISKLYPEDKAIGYKTGQIRGFFWSEY